MKLLDLLPTKFNVNWQAISQNCSEYIHICQTQKKWLYRGTNNPLLINKIYDTPSQRKPRDSDPDASYLYDLLLEQWGVSARRSNSIFTTSDIQQAKYYGSSVYVIFPLNGSHYTWSNNKDITFKRTTMFDSNFQIRQYINEIHKWLDQQRMSSKQFEAFSKWTWANATSQIIMLIKQPEIFSLPEKLQPHIYLDDWKPFTDLDHPLSNALTNGVEVYINGQYYAVNTSYYRQIYTNFGVPVA